MICFEPDVVASAFGTCILSAAQYNAVALSWAIVYFVVAFRSNSIFALLPAYAQLSERDGTICV